MLNELKSKLKELAELRHDIQMSDEYIVERQKECEAIEAYKSYRKAEIARRELLQNYAILAEEINCIIDELYDLTNENSDLSQYLE